MPNPGFSLRQMILFGSLEKSKEGFDNSIYVSCLVLIIELWLFRGCPC